MQHEHEYMDVLTPEGKPTGESVLREKIYADLLPHYIAHVMMLTSKGQFVLQRRSKNKSYMPGKLVTTAGGHVKTGETLLQGSIRELSEEVGEKFAEIYKQSVTESSLQVLVYDDPERVGFRKFIAVSEFRCDELPQSQDVNDVEGFERLSIEQIESMPAPQSEFHPEAYYILKEVYKLKI
jgi:isopentenyldiphosphate isomerase